MDKYLLTKRYLEQGNTLRIMANGNSMYPFFGNQADLLIGSTSLICGCCILAFSDIVGCRVHRIIEEEENGLFVLKGDAIGARERTRITTDNIVGVVIGFYKKQKLYQYKLENCMRLMAKMSRLHADAMKKIKKLRVAIFVKKALAFVYKIIYLSGMHILSFVVNYLLTVQILQPSKKEGTICK